MTRSTVETVPHAFVVWHLVMTLLTRILGKSHDNNLSHRGISAGICVGCTLPTFLGLSNSIPSSSIDQDFYHLVGVGYCRGPTARTSIIAADAPALKKPVVMLHNLLRYIAVLYIAYFSAWRCQVIKVADVACGVGNVLQNKGGIGAFVRVDRTTFLFIAAHLAAHQARKAHVKQQVAGLVRLSAVSVLCPAQIAFCFSQ